MRDWTGVEPVQAGDYRAILDDPKVEFIHSSTPDHWHTKIAIERAYKGRKLTDHFRNFFESVRDRTKPISDVFSHHRALSTCHLAGIAARLNRKIEWDPAAERISGDPQS